MPRAIEALEELRLLVLTDALEVLRRRKLVERAGEDVSIIRADLAEIKSALVGDPPVAAGGRPA